MTHAQHPTPSPVKRIGAPVRSVLIVGGGIAGIAAALRLAEAGVSVTLLEARKKLGGRATSFTDVRTGLVIDNCQHVSLGCCTNYLDFCRRLGVGGKIRWHREIHWVEPGGRTSVMRPGLLPAPGHFTGALLGAAFLSASEKLAVARAMNAVMRTNRERLGAETFGGWLQRHAQPAGLVRKFWEPIIVSACNLSVHRVAAGVALHVFQEGFLAHRDAALMGVAGMPLVELYDPAEAAIRASGGGLRLGVGVRTIREKSVVTADGETLHAGAVICAVPFERAIRLVDAAVRERDGRFDRLGELAHSPILGVHLTFDRPVLDLHSAVLVGMPTQWVFRKDEAGAHMHAVISAADDWMALDEAEVTRRVLDDLHACFARSRDARLLSARPVKEKLATFAPTPAGELVRPTTLGEAGADGVILAGDYVRTGWPATMEGAARSGYLAAAAVLGVPASETLRPPLAPGRFVRVLAPALMPRGPELTAQNAER